MIEDMTVFKLAEWEDPKLVGFEGLDLGNYNVAKALTPYIKKAMHEVERWDRLCAQVVLQGEILRAVPEGDDDPAVLNIVEVQIPSDLRHSMLDWSAGPRPEWPVPQPPDDVRARLDRLDEVLFAPHGMGPKGRVFMNAVTFADVRKWHRDRLDLISQAVFLKLGWMGWLYHPMFDHWGAHHNGMTLEARRQIWVSRLVPEHHIFIDPIESVTPFPRAVQPSDDELIPLDGFPVVKPIPIPETPEAERVQAPKPADCCDKGREYIRESPLAGKVYMRMTVRSQENYKGESALVSYCPWCGTKFIEPGSES